MAVEGELFTQLRGSSWVTKQENMGQNIVCKFKFDYILTFNIIFGDTNLWGDRKFGNTLLWYIRYFFLISVDI